MTKSPQTSDLSVHVQQTTQRYNPDDSSFPS